MPFTAHNPRLFYDAIVTQLVASTGKNIGEVVAPSSNAVPYAVVYPLDEDDTDTSLADPTDVTIFRWQVTSNGDTADQALWMLHKCRVALLGWQPVVAGLACGFVMRDGGQGVQPDFDVPPPRFYAADIFQVLAD